MIAYFAHNMGDKQLVWLALDAKTGEIVGVYIGNHDQAAARKLWLSIRLSNALKTWLG